MLRGDLYNPWFVGETQWGFEIVSGQYQGVVVQIHSVEFSDKEDGTVDLNFTIIKNVDDLESLEIDTKSEEFNHLVEMIINDILKEAMDTYEQAGSHDTQKSDSQ